VSPDPAATETDENPDACAALPAHPNWQMTADVATTTISTRLKHGERRLASRPAPARKRPGWPLTRKELEIVNSMTTSHMNDTHGPPALTNRAPDAAEPSTATEIWSFVRCPVGAIKHETRSIAGEPAAELLDSGLAL
jgi:hypothetical protein